LNFFCGGGSEFSTRISFLLYKKDYAVAELQGKRKQLHKRIWETNGNEMFVIELELGAKEKERSGGIRIWAKVQRLRSVCRRQSVSSYP